MGSGDSASHEYTTDGLWGWGDVDDSESGYISYTPDMGSIDGEVVLDEIYLRIEFKREVPEDDQFININKIDSIKCKSYEFRPDDENQKFYAKRVNRDLIVSYSFLDEASTNTNSEVIRTNIPKKCWKIKVSDDAPVEVIDIGVTFHKQGIDRMPDYYAIDPYETGNFDGFQGKSSLHVVNNHNHKNEKACEYISEYTPVTEDNKKVIVLVHGWNPHNLSDSDAHMNHYAPEPSDMDLCGTVPEEGAAENDWKRVEYKWVHLVKNLLDNPENDEWTITRYDWAQDAATGPCGLFQGSGNANNSRDAALVHGFKLGKILSTIRPTHVHFIAHSAGNWVAKRAAEKLRVQFHDRIMIQITSLDPFVNDNELSNLDLTDDLDWKPNFELMREWTDYLENYYSSDHFNPTGCIIRFFAEPGNIFKPGSDIFNAWTSGRFEGWDINLQLDDELNDKDDRLFDTFMNSHSGPVYWYANTANILKNELFWADSYGYYSSMAARYNPISKDEHKSGEVQANKYNYYGFDVPENVSWLEVNLSAPKDLDLYVRYEDTPSISNYDCKSNFVFGYETCRINNPDSGIWSIGIYGGYQSTYELIATYAVDEFYPDMSVNLIDGTSLDGVVDVTVSASDDTGIDHVDFYLNSDLILSVNKASEDGNYHWIWRTVDYANGSYTVRVFVYDSAGKITYEPATVVVDNNDGNRPPNRPNPGFFGQFEANG